MKRFEPVLSNRSAISRPFHEIEKISGKGYAGGMKERRERWNAIARNNDFVPGTASERAFIKRYFKFHQSTFDSNLSRGFSRRHEAAIRRVCQDNDLPFDPDEWFVPRPKRAVAGGDEIAWLGPPISGTEDFYRQLRALYGSAKWYRCLRVGGIYSRNRTQFEFDKNAWR